MTRPYGRYPKYAKRPGSQEPPKNLRVKLNGRHDLEQVSLLLQKVIARLQDQGVHSVENCAVYLMPLAHDGSRVQLLDHQGKPIDAMEISLPVSARFVKATNPSR
jgi:hypothetical protein